MRMGSPCLWSPPPLLRFPCGLPFPFREVPLRPVSQGRFSGALANLPLWAPPPWQLSRTTNPPFAKRPWQFFRGIHRRVTPRRRSLGIGPPQGPPNLKYTAAPTIPPDFAVPSVPLASPSSRPRRSALLPAIPPPLGLPSRSTRLEYSWVGGVCAFPLFETAPVGRGRLSEKPALFPTRADKSLL